MFAIWFRIIYSRVVFAFSEIIFQARGMDKTLSVRDVKSMHVGKLVTVSGVVIRSTEVKPMASVITYTCDTCACETYQPVNNTHFFDTSI